MDAISETLYLTDLKRRLAFKGYSALGLAYLAPLRDEVEQRVSAMAARKSVPSKVEGKGKEGGK